LGIETKTTLPSIDYNLVECGGEQKGGIMDMPLAAKGMPPARVKITSNTQ
jgi:hypothetical protein